MTQRDKCPQAHACCIGTVGGNPSVLAMVMVFLDLKAGIKISQESECVFFEDRLINLSSPLISWGRLFMLQSTFLCVGDSNLWEIYTDFFLHVQKSLISSSAYGILHVSIWKVQWAELQKRALAFCEALSRSLGLDTAGRAPWSQTNRMWLEIPVFLINGYHQFHPLVAVGLQMTDTGLVGSIWTAETCAQCCPCLQPSVWFLSSSLTFPSVSLCVKYRSCLLSMVYSRN